MDYKDAGVDIEKADALVGWLQKSKGFSSIGGYASMMPVPAGYKEPILVSSTDGVGTKLLLALETGRYDDLAQDLIAMCVNDMICVGAKPLFFLDYYACGKLDADAWKLFLTGLQKGCASIDCELSGGETAEMPGLYSGKHFDCAGFSVGVVEKSKTIGPHLVVGEEVLLALPSSGFHSNGYSLLRQLFKEDMSDFIDELSIPTRLYVHEIQKLLDQGLLKACAHITGGGMDNLLRVLPEDTKAKVNKWEWQGVFAEAQKRSRLDDTKFVQTFNAGVGMVLVVDAVHEAEVKRLLPDVFRLGHLEKLTEKQPSSQGIKPSWEWM